MPRRILIHAGFHKTGTSTLQATLRENRVALKNHVALRLRWHMKELVSATRGFSTWRDPLTLLKVQHRFDRLLAELPEMPHRTLVISSEELAGHLPGRDELADYSAAPELLSTFHDLARARFPEAEILFYLSTRAPEPWLASAYWEHVKASSMTLDFDTFHECYAAAADLDGMVAQIAERLPVPVHHCALEDCRDRSLGPAEPLLDLCDLPLDVQVELLDVQVELVPAPRTNARMGDAVLQALLEANRRHPDPDARNAAKAAILSEARSQ